MKLAVSALALVLASGVAAYAQSSGTPTSPSAPGASGSNLAQCWDMATNTLRNKSDPSGSASATGPKGNASTSQAQGGMAPSGSTSGNASGSAAATRPANVPNC